MDAFRHNCVTNGRCDGQRHLIFAIGHTLNLTPITAQLLLLKCHGDEIWDLESCRVAGVPESWIDELTDTFESGFDSDRNTIYHQNQMVNHFHGVLDLHLAYKLAEFLGIDWQHATAAAIGRRAEVDAIKAELDEL